MNKTLIYFDGSNIEPRHDLTIELFIDEVAEIRPATTIEFVDGPGGEVPSMADSQLRCTEAGRYRFRLVNALGVYDLHVLCVSPDVVEFIRKQVRGVGHGDSQMVSATDAKVRSVVRSLANHADWFDGSLASLTTGEPSRTLASFGC